MLDIPVEFTEEDCLFLRGAGHGARRQLEKQHVDSVSSLSEVQNRKYPDNLEVKPRGIEVIDALNWKRSSTCCAVYVFVSHGEVARQGLVDALDEPK